MNLPSGKSKLASSSQKANFTITGFYTTSEKKVFSLYLSQCASREIENERKTKSGSGWSFFINFQLRITDHFSSYWENTNWIRQAQFGIQKHFAIKFTKKNKTFLKKKNREIKKRFQTEMFAFSWNWIFLWMSNTNFSGKTGQFYKKVKKKKIRTKFFFEIILKSSFIFTEFFFTIFYCFQTDL